MTKAELMGGRGAARLALASGRQHPHFPRDVLIALEKKKKNINSHRGVLRIDFSEKDKKRFFKRIIGALASSLD